MYGGMASLLQSIGFPRLKGNCELLFGRNLLVLPVFRYNYTYLVSLLSTKVDIYIIYIYITYICRLYIIFIYLYLVSCIINCVLYILYNNDTLWDL